MIITLDQLLEASEAFLTEFPDGSKLAWKLLSLKQYEAIRGLVRTGLLDEGLARQEAVRLAVFGDNKYYDLFPAGYIDSVGTLILWYSGDCDQHTIRNDIEMLREVHTGTTVYEHMVKIVLVAFPGMTIDQVEGWTRSKLLNVFVQAEHVVAYQYGEGFQYLDTSSIRIGTEEAEPEPMPMGVNIEAEREAQLQDGYNPWAETDRISETEEASAWSALLTKEQLAKLDRSR